MVTRGSKQIPVVLAPGNVAALVVKDGTAQNRCYVGKVLAVDEHGVRLTLMDWRAASFRGWDFFAPWENVSSAMVAEGGDASRFFDMASDLEVWWDSIHKGREAADKAVAAFRSEKGK